MGENHNMSSGPQKGQMSALESINASFVNLKEEAAREKKSLEPYKLRVEHSSTVDRINASFAAAQKEAERRGRRNDRETQVNFLWNVITGVLVAALVISTVVFLVMIYRGHTEEEEGVNPPPAVTMSETNTERQSEESEELTESQTAAADTEETSGTETAGEQDTEEETAQTEQGDTPREIPEEYEDILTDNEKEEWKSRAADSSRLFVQMNQKLNVDGDQKVYIRLVNPPYSAFDIQIKIYTQDDPDTVLYQSEILKPGEILEYAEFENIPEAGDYTAGVEYTVYDSGGNRIGTHEVAVDITVQGQQEAAGQ